MQRRQRIAVSFLVLVALLGLPLAEAVYSRPALAAAQPGDPQPSILVIQTDDMRADDLKAMPRLRKLLAAGGIIFENYMAGGTPLCCPSRATALTGKYPHNTGVTNNDGPNGGHGAFVANGNEADTIGTVLQDAGYRTGFTGKYLNGYPVGRQNSYVPEGWDAWYSIIMSSKFGTKGYYYDYRMNENGKVRVHRSKAKDYSTTLQTRRALKIIKHTPEGTPLFLWVNPLAPHKPAIPAPGDGNKKVPTNFKTLAFNAKPVGKAPSLAGRPKLSKHQKAKLVALNEKRRRSLLAVDRMVEHLAAEMPAGSYIFFLSDNGYNLGEFRLPGFKHVPYQSAANVPLVIIGPGFNGQATVPDLASSIDLAPTWADLGGANMEETDGISLVPLLIGSNLPERESILLSWAGSTAASLQADLDGDPPLTDGSGIEAGRDREKERKEWKRGQSEAVGIESYNALRGEDWLYIEWESGHREYYDLTEDPYELTNIVSELPPVELDDLSSALEQRTTCEGVTCR